MADIGGEIRLGQGQISSCQTLTGSSKLSSACSPWSWKVNCLPTSNWRTPASWVRRHASVNRLVDRVWDLCPFFGNRRWAIFECSTHTGAKWGRLRNARRSPRRSALASNCRRLRGHPRRCVDGTPFAVKGAGRRWNPALRCDRGLLGSVSRVGTARSGADGPRRFVVREGALATRRQPV